MDASSGMTSTMNAIDATAKVHSPAVQQSNLSVTKR